MFYFRLHERFCTLAPMTRRGLALCHRLEYGARLEYMYDIVYNKNEIVREWRNIELLLWYESIIL